MIKRALIVGLVYWAWANAGAAPVAGDVNGDSVLTQADAVLLRNHLIGKASFTAAQQTQADVNGDTQITVADLVGLNNLLKGTIAIDVTPNAASWTLSGPAGFATLNGSGDRLNAGAITRAPLGLYTLTFHPLAGYSTPAAVSRTLGAGATLQFSIQYPVALKKITLNLPGNVPMILVRCPAGSFMMGRSPGERDSMDFEDQRHQVILSRAFYIGQYEVTKRQWQALIPTTPWDGDGHVIADPESPAVDISWNDIAAPGGYIEKLNQHLAATGQAPATLRLPSEAEFEYATRAGTTTRFPWGDDPAYAQLGKYAWYDANSLNAGEKYAHVVGLLQPNAWGIHDMHGNCWEWCQDWWADRYSSESVTDPAGPATGKFKTIRGGGWGARNDECRSAAREDHFHLYADPPFSERPLDYEDSTLGFRLARTD